MCCSVLQCVAAVKELCGTGVCCSVLQCVAVCCRVLQIHVTHVKELCGTCG